MSALAYWVYTRHDLERRAFLQAYYSDTNAEYVTNYTFLMARAQYSGVYNNEIQILFRQVCLDKTKLSLEAETEKAAIL